MSYTYNLVGTINTGRKNPWGSDSWANFEQAPESQLGFTGYEYPFYYATNILFDANALSALREKTLESMTLEVNIPSGWAKNSSTGK